MNIEGELSKQGRGWSRAGKEKRIKESKGSVTMTKIPYICITY